MGCALDTCIATEGTAFGLGYSNTEIIIQIVPTQFMQRKFVTVLITMDSMIGIFRPEMNYTKCI